MKKIVLIAVTVITVLVGCAPQERMDAYVRAAHPTATEIKRIDETYVLCDNGKVWIVNTSRSMLSADIMGDVELPNTTCVVPAN